MQTSSRLTSVALVILLFLLLILQGPVIAKEIRVKADSEANTLIRELEIRESKQPARDMPGWKMPKKVVVMIPNSRIPSRPDYKNWLQSAAGEAELVFIKSREEFEFESDDTDVYLGYCQHVSEDMGKLSWVQNYFVGVDRCANNKKLMNDTVLLTNTSAIPGPGMAEHTIAMMLILTRKMHVFYSQQQQQLWRRLGPPAS